MADLDDSASNDRNSFTTTDNAGDTDWWGVAKDVGNTVGDWWGAAKDVGNTVGDWFSGEAGGRAGQFASFAGLATLLNELDSGAPNAPSGYQGGVPEYTATRTQYQLPNEMAASRRPGQGGITYFSPMTYTATGKDMAAPAAGDTYGGIGGLTQGATPGTSLPNNAYTDADLMKAIQESMAQGYSLDDTKWGATQKYGITEDQWKRAVQQMGMSKPVAPATGSYTDQQLREAIAASQAQGYSLADTKKGAMEKYGITETQWNRVANAGQPSASAATNLYSDSQLRAAIQASMAQGYTLADTKKGAMEKYGITETQWTRVAGTVNPAATGATEVAKAAPSTAPVPASLPAAPLYSDDTLRAAIQASMAQGYSLEDTKWGAMNKYGITEDQWNRVVGQGFADGGAVAYQPRQWQNQNQSWAERRPGGAPVNYGQTQANAGSLQPWQTNAPGGAQGIGGLSGSTRLLRSTTGRGTGSGGGSRTTYADGRVISNRPMSQRMRDMMATGQYGSPEQAQREIDRQMENNTFRSNAYSAAASGQGTFGTNAMTKDASMAALQQLQNQGLKGRELYTTLQAQYGIDPREYKALLDISKGKFTTAGSWDVYNAQRNDPNRAATEAEAARLAALPPPPPPKPVYNDTVETLQRQLSEARAAMPGVTSSQLKQVAFDTYGVSDDQWNAIDWSKVPGRAAGGGVSSLSSRFVQGPGDGVSDGIPALINGQQPARMADGEFVVDARTVAEIGNGSSQAGAKKLYAMQDRVRRARKTAPIGKPSKADKYLPA